MSTVSWLLLCWAVSSVTFLLGMAWGVSSGFRRGQRDTERRWVSAELRRQREATHP